ncbi:MAG TPA: DUF885 domain-containing protein [Thermoanaerobaculia bacterium]|jgi:uncharacterized protein (DUF885 family)
MSIETVLRSIALLTVVAGAALAAPPPDAAARFADLVDREWQWRLREFPTFATAVGVNDYNDRLDDASLAAAARRDGETAAFLAELEAIDRAALAAADRLDYDIFRRQLEERRDSFRFGDHLLTLNADSGFHTGFSLLHMGTPFSTPQDYENYLSRLAAFPAWLDAHVERMREGLRRGMTIPKATLAGIETSIRPLVDAAPEAHPVYAPFTRFPATFAAVTRERLSARGREVVATAIVPGYARFLDFVTGEYVPGCRETLAATDLPGGEAYYRFQIRSYTTLDMEPRAIHELGLREVAAIRAEMEKIVAATGFAGSFDEFLRFLRTDARFYATTPEQLLKEAAWIAKRMDAKLPSLFGRLPRQPYGVMAVPAQLAPKYTSGRYSGSPKDSTEPGWYWVNTFALDKRPLYNLEALTLHEAVPGHHLQGALAEEAESVRPFRRYDYISAFGEGWGLYSEYLGNEAGFYTDSYSKFGYLGYQAWRACRLVIDTGIHAFGWSRERAIDYLAANTSLPLHEATTEIDRYISWPGQALSYYLGYLEIRELRRRAEATLGERFDVRGFHDAVLEQGALPLPMLREHIEAWIAERERGGS